MHFVPALTLLLLAQSGAPAERSKEFPWVEVGVELAGSFATLQDVSLCVAGDGAIVASCVQVDALSEPLTLVSRSTDGGRTWERAGSIPTLGGATLFANGDRLWLLGVDGGAGCGSLTLRSSSDGGRTWTNPVDEHTGRLRGKAPFLSESCAVVVHGGRIHKLLGVRAPSFAGEERTHVLVASAALESNWFEESSWRFSNEVPLEPIGARFGGDGAVLVAPVPSRLLVLLRGSLPRHEGQVIVNVADKGRSLVASTDTEKPSTPFPVCSTSLPIDPVSWRVLALVNETERFERASDQPELRNCVKLYSSQNMKQWQERTTLIMDLGATEIRGAAFVVQDADLLMAAWLPRVVLPDSMRGTRPESLFFLRVPAFRTRTEEAPPVWTAISPR